MPCFSQLAKRQQARFLLQLVDLLVTLGKRHQGYHRYAFALPTIQNGPELYILNEKLVWDFTLRSNSDSQSCSTQMVLHADSLWDERSAQDQDITALLKSRIFQYCSFSCSCMPDGQTGSSYLCQHVSVVIDFLRKRLERASTEEAIAWIDGCIAEPTQIGQRLVMDLENAVQDEGAQPELPSEACRVIWRITPLPQTDDLYRPFDLALILQRPKGRNGWTVGKHIRDPLTQLPEHVLHNTHDRALAMICENYFGRYASYPEGPTLIHILEILKECPHVVWNSPGYPSARIHRGDVSLKLIEAEGDFLPEVWLDDRQLHATDLEVVPDGRSYAVIVNSEDHSIVYCTLTSKQADIISMTQRARRLGARLDRAHAERFSSAISRGSVAERLNMQVPDSLAGPDVVLPPVVELQLTPIDRHMTEARLRVSCSVLLEPPVPGLGAAKTLVHTPAGAYHLVRDLPAEILAADHIASSLRLGDFSFDGPYVWQLHSLEDALQLIERIRLLGDAAPIVCWPKSKPLSLIGDITPQALRVRLTSARDWFGIEGELEVAGLHVPLAELLVAMRSGGRYVPLGNNQFATISDELRNRLRTIDDLAANESKGLRLSKAAATLVDQAIGEDIPVERDLRWQQLIEQLSASNQQPSQPPDDLQAELRDYQVSGYQWLAKLSQWGLGACLADDMGLGKTVQTLGVLLDRQALGPALIVAPTSVGINWVRETQRFAPSLTPHLYREHDRDHLIQQARPGQLIIISYQLLQRDIDRLAGRKWSTLVLDEAQFIKNFHTKTNQAVRRLEVDWCVALSGTPLENHLGELWSLMRVLSPGLLGSWERFRTRFAEPIEKHREQERLRALARVVQPFILRRTKQEVLSELPPRTEVVLSAELSPNERKRYDAARLAALSDLTNAESPDNAQQKRIRVLAWLTRLRQLACHPALVDARWNKSSAKLDLFMETVAELRANNHRALVFSQFVQHLSLVRAALDQANISYQYLDGSTPPVQRQQAVDAFQAGHSDLFLISLKAGGTGLNLTAADYVLHLDPWWNPAVEDQATDRAHRIGQLRPVTVYRLVAKDTIEEQILAMHDNKRELLAGVLEGADRAGNITTEELVNLIRDGQQVAAIQGF